LLLVALFFSFCFFTPHPNPLPQGERGLILASTGNYILSKIEAHPLIKKPALARPVPSPLVGEG